MDKVATANLNSFASNGMQADFVPTSEPSITVPASLLQDLLGAIQDLKEEVAQLREERDQDRQEIAALRARIASLETTEEQDISRLSLDVAYDRQRLAKLEQPPEPATTKKSTGHVDELHRLMVEDRSQQVSIAKAARLLDISKERMRQLKPLILQDGRFEMGWGQVKGKKAVVIRIRQFLK